MINTRYEEILDLEKSTFFNDVYIAECSNNMPFFMTNVAIVGLLLVTGVVLTFFTRKFKLSYNDYSSLLLSFIILCIFNSHFSYIWSCLDSIRNDI